MATFYVETGFKSGDRVRFSDAHLYTGTVRTWVEKAHYERKWDHVIPPRWWQLLAKRAARLDWIDHLQWAERKDRESDDVSVLWDGNENRISCDGYLPNVLELIPEGEDPRGV